MKIPWTCKECIFEILPVNACSKARSRRNKSIPKFKVKCSACNGYSYSITKIRTCDYCMEKVHLKCWNNSLGCNKCCENLIPGFYAYSYELIGDPYYNNTKIFNPYDSNHFTQLIGEVFGGEDEINRAFNDASDLLVNCKYKQPRKMDEPSDRELSIFSLNIATLRSKIDTLRENISFYNCFDVLLLTKQTALSKSYLTG